MYVTTKRVTNAEMTYNTQYYIIFDNQINILDDLIHETFKTNGTYV